MSRPHACKATRNKGLVPSSIASFARRFGKRGPGDEL